MNVKRGHLLAPLLLAMAVLLPAVACDSPDRLRQKAEAAYRQGDDQLAIELFSKALGKGSRKSGFGRPDVLYAGRGLARMKAGDVDAAQADFSAAIELHPTAEYHLYRSRTRRQRNEIAKAVADLRSALGLDSKHAEASLDLCLLLVGSEGVGAALEHCVRAARSGQPIPADIKPTLATELSRLAEEAYGKEDYAAYLGRHEELHVLAPEAVPDTFQKSRLAQVHFRYGEQLLREGARDRAIDQYAAAMKLDARDPYRRRAVSVLLAAAESSEGRGAYGAAVGYYERALELAGGARGSVESRLDRARRLHWCHDLKVSADSDFSRIDWRLVERANEILGRVNRGVDASLDEALFIRNNAAGLADSVQALFSANDAYKNLMNAGCPSQISDDALRSNVRMMTAWLFQAHEITRFLADRMGVR